MNEVDTDGQSGILGWLPEGYFCFKFLFQSRPVHWQKWNKVCVWGGDVENAIPQVLLVESADIKLFL